MPAPASTRLGLVGPLGSELIAQGDDVIRGIISQLEATAAGYIIGGTRPAASAANIGTFHLSGGVVSFSDGATWTQIDPATLVPGYDNRADVYANRPTPSGALDGVRFFATDKGMEWMVVSGAWTLVNVLAPEVTSLPALPVDQQECIYIVDAAKGIKWHLRYRAASTSTYKWEVIGGPPIQNSGTSTQSSTGAYTDVGTSITLPLAGDYDVTVGGLCSYEGGAVGNYSADGVLGYSINGATPNATYGTRHVLPNNGSGLFGWVSGSRDWRQTSLPTATVLAMKVWAISFINGGGGTFSVRDRFIEARPIRLG